MLIDSKNQSELILSVRPPALFLVLNLQTVNFCDVRLSSRRNGIEERSDQTTFPTALGITRTVKTNCNF